MYVDFDNSLCSKQFSSSPCCTLIVCSPSVCECTTAPQVLRPITWQLSPGPPKYLSNLLSLLSTPIFCLSNADTMSSAYIIPSFLHYQCTLQSCPHSSQSNAICNLIMSFLYFKSFIHSPQTGKTQVLSI